MAMPGGSGGPPKTPPAGPGPYVPGTVMSFPRVPLPSSPDEGVHLQKMQWMNVKMWHWRNRAEAFPGAKAYPNFKKMPIPWRDRQRPGEDDPAIFQPLGDPASWTGKMASILASDRGNLAEAVALALQNNQALPGPLADVWNRFQEVKQFFDSAAGVRGRSKDGPPLPAPKVGQGSKAKQQWTYKKILGKGGNGLALHYQVKAAPGIEWDVAVKTHLRAWTSDDLRYEREMMKKLTNSSHIVQELPRSRIGKKAEQNIKLDWKSDDSSEEYDTSGDEDLEAPTRRRKARKDLTDAERLKKRGRWNSNAFVNPFALAAVQLPSRKKDFLVLEFVEGGDLYNLIAKLREGGARIPQRVMWSWWLCLIKACIAMAFYPRKFHPLRMNSNPTEANLAGTDLDEIIPDAKYHWRKKNMVHFDLDPTNVFVAGLQQGDTDHSLVPKLKVADFGWADEVKDQKRDMYYLKYRHRSKWVNYAPEQFGAEWDYLPSSRNGDNICDQPVAGNFGSHTNIYWIGLAMLSIITQRLPAQPPLRGRMRPQDNDPAEIETYGTPLFQNEYDHVDPELRKMVARCLAHDPRNRPGLVELEQHATFNIARVAAIETDDYVRQWYRTEVIGAAAI